ncbi:MAG: AAA family ATPase [Deltaproteobacteria bacterium]|nr:AAA family ATPase [Deltaproteobacteria bacterium]
MKICKLIIRGYQQFENTDLDFTDPATGEPANRICLIGRNGTGKTTVLRILNQLLSAIPGELPQLGTLFAVKLKTDIGRVYMVKRAFRRPVAFLHESIENAPGWIDVLAKEIDFPQYRGYLLEADQQATLATNLRLKDNSTDLVVNAPCETQQNTALAIADVPNTNLNQALGLFRNFPFHHTVSNQTVAEMWRVLVYLVKKRENDRNEFEAREENLTKTKGELIEEFDRSHPKILHEIAELWNEILDRAGLELDEEGATNPIQLNDNLKAYIRLKSTKQTIAYNQLSTGMRDFLFRLGHIYLLYFGRKIERGFLLVDEPENSLFPDFLFNLMETYDKIVGNEDGNSNTQMFFATHNPIIAAQFQPHERIILEWDENGHVVAKKGRAPIGDDPNDLLRKDFELTHLMGKAGEAKWQEYLDLRAQIRRSDDKAEKDDLLARASELGQSYGFSTTKE